MFSFFSFRLLNSRSKSLAVTVVLFLSSLVSANVFSENLILEVESADNKAKGKVVIELLESKAPKHVERIKKLVAEGLYDGVVFHRVISGFMAQTGDVQFGNIANFNSSRVGTGSSEYDDLSAEFSDIPFKEGVLGMARGRDINSANSQFFIMTAYHSSLNGAYTVLGKVTKGLDLVRSIKAGPQSKNGKVAQPDRIKKATIQP